MSRILLMKRRLRCEQLRRSVTRLHIGNQAQQQRYE
jgi:hypothetical protein